MPAARPDLAHLRALAALLALPVAAGAQDAAPAARAARTLSACFVPGSGTVYRIREAGAPEKCAAGHTEFSWGDAAADASSRSGPVETQASGGANAAPSGVAGGDLAGSYPDPTVARLQGRPVSAAAPAVGQLLGWNGSAWTPTATAAGGALALPYSGTVSHNNSALVVTNTGDGGGASFWAAGAWPGVFASGKQGHGVSGRSLAAEKAGVHAYNVNPGGIALQIGGGGVRVENAGQDTKTPVFWTEMRCQAKYIDSPFSNGRPDAMILATARTPLPDGKPATAFVHYDAAAGKWMLKSNNVLLSGLCLPIQVNVLIVRP